MTPLEKFLRWIVTIDVWDVAKIMMLVGLGLYLVFGVIVIRQTGLMSRALNGSLDMPIKLLAWVHLVVAVGVFLLAVVVL